MLDVLLIGVGAVGEVIAKHLADDNYITLTVADIDERRLRSIKRKLRVNVRYEVVDRKESDDLENIIKGADMVINAANPKLNLRLMQMCQKHSVHYMDLASNDIDEQLAMNDEWEKRNILGLICMGEDPGLSNMYARYAADRMTQLYSVKIRDGEFSKSRKYPLVALFSPEIFFEEILMPSVIFENGKYKRVPPFYGRETYEFPDPVGELTVYSVDHEEVYTLPRYLPKGVRYVDFKLALSDELINAIRLLKKIGMLKSRKLRVKNATVAPRDVLFALMPKPSEISRHIEGHASLVVETEGEIKGKKASLTLYTLMSHEEAHKLFRTNATAYLTGTIPAALASLIARDEIEEKGVIVPEQLDPEPVITEIAKRNVLSYIEVSEEGLMIEKGTVAKS